jgi:hypothetical protein
MSTIPSYLTDQEVITDVMNGIDHHPIDLAKRFEIYMDQNDVETVIDEEEAVGWAIACFNEHAGEDFHGDVIDDLHAALKMNKPEMIAAIKGVINTLTQMDTAACHEMTSMRVDGVQ